MISYGVKQWLTVSEGFNEVYAWREYQHGNGLHVCFDDHEWEIEDINDTWLERGSLNDLSALEDIIKDYRKDPHENEWFCESK